MKFVPTVDLWDPAFSTLIREGRLNLQVGQWVRCGSQDKRSRIVEISHGTVWAIHPNHQEKGRQSLQYNRWLEIVRDRRTERNWMKGNNHA